MVRFESAAGEIRLAAYRCLLENARAILRAAEEGRWNDLSTLDGERRDCLARVRQSDASSAALADSQVLIELIQSILECDEQTKRLVKGCQTELLASVGNSRKLANAYGNG